MHAFFPIFLTVFLLLSCGGDNTAVFPDVIDAAPVITIESQTFIPEEITAAAGDIIYFINNDTVSHHILSQSGEGLFDNSGQFDSSVIPAGDARPVTIPDTAVSGAVFYFYCDLMRDVMITPNGTITVE